MDGNVESRREITPDRARGAALEISMVLHHFGMDPSEEEAVQALLHPERWTSGEEPDIEVCDPDNLCEGCPTRGLEAEQAPEIREEVVGAVSKALTKRSPEKVAGSTRATHKGWLKSKKLLEHRDITQDPALEILGWVAGGNCTVYNQQVNNEGE